MRGAKGTDMPCHMWGTCLMCPCPLHKQAAPMRSRFFLITWARALWAHPQLCSWDQGLLTSTCGSYHLLVRITFGCFHHPQQAPVCDFFAPGQPQNYQPLQVGGDRSHWQVSHVDTWGQVQLAQGFSKKLSEGEHCKILHTEGKNVCFMCTFSGNKHKLAVQTAAHPNVRAAFKVQGLQLCSTSTGSLQAFHYLCSTHVQTLRQIHARQGRQGQEVSKACGWHDTLCRRQDVCRKGVQLMDLEPAFTYFYATLFLWSQNYSFSLVGGCQVAAHSVYCLSTRQWKWELWHWCQLSPEAENWAIKRDLPLKP